MVLEEQLTKHGQSLGAALSAFSAIRNADAEAIVDLSMYNYVEVTCGDVLCGYVWCLMWCFVVTNGVACCGDMWCIVVMCSVLC